MLDHAEVKKLLPHRYPMLLVDAVASLEPWTRIVGRKSVTGSEPCFAALGDEAPAASYAYPPTLVLESFAQTAGILMNGHWQHMGSPDQFVLVFASLSGARFTGEPVLPGDTMEHRTCLERPPTDVAFLKGDTWVGGRLIASVERIVVACRRLDGAPAAAPEPNRRT